MTMREVKKFIDGLSEAQLDATATVYDPGIEEYIPIAKAYTETEDSCDGVLDCSDYPHPVFKLAFN